MLSLSFTTLLITLLALSPAASLPHSPPIDSYIIPGNNTFPEGVARQPNSPYFYTGSLTDGTIFRGDIRKPNVEVFIPPNAEGTPIIAGMKVDDSGRLYVAGGPSGILFVYDTATGNLLHRFKNKINGTFLNDLAVADDGAVYVTDSAQPYLYYITRKQLRGDVDQELGVFTSLLPEFKYQSNFNANGVVVTSDQRYLIVGDWGERAIFRICLASREITPIDLGGKTIGNTDGLLLRGSLLYSVNSNISLGVFIDVIEIKEPYLEATPLRQITSPLLVLPATAAWDGDDLLVTNFQNGLIPKLPFNIVRVSIN